MVSSLIRGWPARGIQRSGVRRSTVWSHPSVSPRRGGRADSGRTKGPAPDSFKGPDPARRDEAARLRLSARVAVHHSHPLRMTTMATNDATTPMKTPDATVMNRDQSTPVHYTVSRETHLVYRGLMARYVATTLRPGTLAILS